MIKYAVVYQPESGHIETFGPFEKAADAKSWMAQDLNSAIEAAEKSGVEIQHWWSEDRLCSCGIQDIGTWEVTTLSL